MNRNVLFVITLIIVAGLSGAVAYGMFEVGTFVTFEKSKLYFAAAVLAFLAFIFLLAMIFYALGPEPTDPTVEAPAKNIFDACVKIIPPMVTLIFGFYFGSSQVQDKSTLPSTEQTQPLQNSDN